MTVVSIRGERAHAAAIATRLGDKGLGAGKKLGAHAKPFLDLQARFEAASAEADAAEVARSEALAAIGALDDALDASVDEYADAVSAAKLGPRANPFSPFSKYSPTKLKDRPYAEEPNDVRALVAAVGKKGPPAAVVAAGKACLARCAAVEKALAAYTKPTAAYEKALAARNAVLPDLLKAKKTLRVHAAAALIDDPATLKALFAKPTAVQAPKQRRAARAKAAEGAAPTPA